MTNSSGGSPVGTRFTGFVPTVTIGKPALPGQSVPATTLRSPVSFHGVPTPPLDPITGAAERNFPTSGFVADAIRGGSERRISRHLVARLAASDDEAAQKPHVAKSGAGAKGKPGHATIFVMEAVGTQKWSSEKTTWIYSVLKQLETFYGQQNDWPTDADAVTRYLGIVYDRLTEDERTQELEQLTTGDVDKLRRYWFGIHQPEEEIREMVAVTAQFNVEEIAAAVEADAVRRTAEVPRAATMMAMAATQGLPWEVVRALSRPVVRDALTRDDSAVVAWGKAQLPSLFPGIRLTGEATPAYVLTILVNAIFNRIKAAEQLVDLVKVIFAEEAAERELYNEPELTYTMSEIRRLTITRLEALLEHAPVGVNAQYRVSYANMTRESLELMRATTINPLYALAKGFSDVVRGVTRDDMPSVLRLALGEVVGIGGNEWETVLGFLRSNPLFQFTQRYDVEEPNEEMEVAAFRALLTERSTAERGHGTQQSLRVTRMTPPEWYDAMKKAWMRVWQVDDSSGTKQYVIDRAVIEWAERHLRPRYNLPTKVSTNTLVADSSQTSRYVYQAARELFLHLRGLTLIADMLSRTYNSSLSATQLLLRVQTELNALETTPPVGLSWQARAQYKIMSQWTMAMLKRRHRQALAEIAKEYYDVVNLLAMPDIPAAYRIYVMAAYGVGAVAWDEFEALLKDDPLYQAARLIRGGEAMSRLREQRSRVTGEALTRVELALDRCRQQYIAALDEWENLDRGDIAAQGRFGMVYVLLRETPSRLRDQANR